MRHFRVLQRCPLLSDCFGAFRGFAYFVSGCPLRWVRLPIPHCPPRVRRNTSGTLGRFPAKLGVRAAPLGSVAPAPRRSSCAAWPRRRSRRCRCGRRRRRIAAGRSSILRRRLSLLGRVGSSPGARSTWSAARHLGRSAEVVLDP